jgi:hypothetical protein
VTARRGAPAAALATACSNGKRFHAPRLGDPIGKVREEQLADYLKGSDDPEKTWDDLRDSLRDAECYVDDAKEIIGGAVACLLPWPS